MLSYMLAVEYRQSIIEMAIANYFHQNAVLEQILLHVQHDPVLCPLKTWCTISAFEMGLSSIDDPVI